MKTIAFALLLVAAADDRSLGIGLDVLPEAFVTAAARVSYAPDLHLSRCTNRGCRWDLGDGVEVSADLSDGSLSIERIEARWDIDRSTTPASAGRYRDACLTIVALVAPDLPRTARTATADAIAAPPGPTRDVLRPEDGLAFYGTRSRPGTVGDASMTCGAVAD